MAALLGGTQSLHTNALDEALALPTTDFSPACPQPKLVLQEESGLPRSRSARRQYYARH